MKTLKGKVLFTFKWLSFELKHCHFYVVAKSTLVISNMTLFWSIKFLELFYNENENLIFILFLFHLFQQFLFSCSKRISIIFLCGLLCQSIICLFLYLFDSFFFVFFALRNLEALVNLNICFM